MGNLLSSSTVRCLLNGLNNVMNTEDWSSMQLISPSTAFLLISSSSVPKEVFRTLYTVNSFIRFHIAHKKIPTINDRGIAIEPDSNNGYKMEMFIFDSLEFSANPCAFFVPRFGNFSPLKNAPDQGNSDSPETARKDFSDFCIEMAEKAGATIIKSENEIFEISPLISLNGEGLETIVSGKTFSLPHYLY